MFYVYIIQSHKTGKYYISSCQNLLKRIKEHNKGKSKSTKFGRPWKAVYCEQYKTRQLAYKRERQIKSYKGGNAFKKLINKHGEVA